MARLSLRRTTATPLSIVIAVAGGEPSRSLTLGAAHLAHSWPQVLADGRVLLFVRSADPTVQGIYVTSLDSPESCVDSRHDNERYRCGRTTAVRPRG